MILCKGLGCKRWKRKDHAKVRMRSWRRCDGYVWNDNGKHIQYGNKRL